MTNTEKLIELVKSYPVLYNFTHEDYKNIRKKDKVWFEIGRQLSKNGDEVKKKWKNLRDTYAKYVRCNKRRTRQAANNYRKWIWADQMKYFDNYLSYPKTSSNINDASFVDIEKDAKSEKIAECAENIETVDHQSSNSTPVSPIEVTTLTSKDSTSQKTKRKCNNSGQPSISDVIKYFENKKRPQYDAIDHIFLGYAKTIKTFSGTRQAITKLKIAQIIMEQELLHQEELTSTNISKPENVITHQDNTHL